MNLVQRSSQYRGRYAEPEAQLASFVSDSFEVVAVVPACAESPSFVDGYRAAARNAEPVLVIVVINGRVDAAESVHAANAECFRELRLRFSLREVRPGGWWGRDASMSLLVVDRFSLGRRLPRGQGVGLARKVGADVALACIAAGRVRHPCIAMTDGDATLPADYFERITSLEPIWSAVVFPFWHDPSGDGAVDRATALYEVRLRYLQRGLEWAGSPYAFHSMGSATAVNALCYAQVRGVPARQAAEDFYLLDKLSKVRPVARIGGDPIRLRSRVSDRVPFGTGAAARKLVRGAESELYHPQCFDAVRSVVGGLRRLATDRPNQETVESVLSDLGRPTRDFLVRQGALDTWSTLGGQAPSDVERLRRFHVWFDGFRTLKLIHHVRDRGMASLQWQEAIGRAPFMNDFEDDGGCLTGPREELLRLEESDPRFVGPTVISRAGEDVG